MGGLIKRLLPQWNISTPRKLLSFQNNMYEPRFQANNNRQYNTMSKRKHIFQEHIKETAVWNGCVICESCYSWDRPQIIVVKPSELQSKDWFWHIYFYGLWTLNWRCSHCCQDSFSFYRIGSSLTWPWTLHGTSQETDRNRNIKIFEILSRLNKNSPTPHPHQPPHTHRRVLTNPHTAVFDPTTDTI